MINLNQGCNDVVAVLIRKGRRSEWNLIVISGFFTNRCDGEKVLECYEGNGDMDSYGFPSFLIVKTGSLLQALHVV